MKLGNIISSIVVVVLGVFIILQSNNFPDEVASAPGPGIYPSLLGWLLVLLGSILLIQTFVFRKKEEIIVTFTSKQALFIYKLIGVSVLYCIVLPFLGFAITSFLFLIITSFMLGLKKYRLLILIPMVSIILILFIFGTIFHIPLPGQTIF